MADDDSNPLQTAQEYFARGNKRLSAGDYDGAITDSSKAIQLKKNFWEAWNVRGVAWRKKGEYDQAIIDHTEAINLNSGSALSLFYRGLAQRERGKYGRAISDYDKAINLESSEEIRAAICNARGFAYSKQGNINEALDSYNEAIKFRQNYALALYNRGIIREKKNEYGGAIEDYSQAIDLKPDYAKAWNARGISWRRKGDYIRAVRDHKEAIRLNPENKIFAYNLSLTLSLQDTERTRIIATEDLREEYSKQLRKELEDAKRQITADTKEFRALANENMNRSEKLRKWAVGILILIALGLLKGIWIIYCIETQDGKLSQWAFFSWVPVVTALSSPFFLLWWMLQKWSYELKTLSYGFQRKAIVEERLFHYAGNDEKFLQELLKLYLTHWMEKSPLEVMLAIGGKSKGMGGSDSPTAALLGKIEEGAKTASKVSSNLGGN